MSILRWPYVEGVGAWGENTSAYNFCEMDYYITPYIAEFISTSTNLGYIYLGYKGIMNNRKNKNDIVINVCYALLSFIGIGSAIYHAAPKYFSQMIDEFAMLYACAGILYGALSITLGGSARKSLAILLSVFITLISIAHAMLGHVKAFRLTFLILLLSVLGQLVFLVSARVPDAKVRKEGSLLALCGAVNFLSGYVFWNVDMHLCGHLSSARDVVGMPLGFVTEFHGWWHLLTGVAVYYDIVFIEYLRLYIASTNSTTKYQPKIKLIWPNFFTTLTLPHLEVIQQVKMRKS